MLKTFPIDFIRQAFEQTLLKEHIENVNLFGGKNQVNIFSFYEQLKTQEQVDRFVENWRDLANQQNKAGLILNGVIASPENPSITNLYSSLIIPMSFTCMLRSTLADRDNSIITINNLIDKLKGKKVDIAQLNCVDSDGNKYTEPFMVGTIGQGNGEPILKDGDYIGEVSSTTEIPNKVMDLKDNGVLDNSTYLYCKNDNQLRVALKRANTLLETENAIIVQQFYDDSSKLYKARVKFISEDTMNLVPLLIFPRNGTVDVSLINDENVEDLPCTINVVSYEINNSHLEIVLDFLLSETYSDGFVENGVYDAKCNIYYSYFDFIEDDGTYGTIIFPPEHESFEKYKLSFSFDAIRCDEPRNLNAEEYCELSFGGSATLVSDGVKLGNDLLKISFKKYLVKAQSIIEFNDAPTYYLEPLEMPSGNNANTQINQLVSNKFISNSHTDAIALTLQYTFILDENIELLNQLFEYGRYGTRGISVNDITPNLIFLVNEIWCSWGNFKKIEFYSKIVENIDIENTESDTLTLSISMQIQGDND